MDQPGSGCLAMRITLANEGVCAAPTDERSDPAPEPHLAWAGLGAARAAGIAPQSGRTSPQLVAASTQPAGTGVELAAEPPSKSASAAPRDSEHASAVQPAPPAPGACNVPATHPLDGRAPPGTSLVRPEPAELPAAHGQESAGVGKAGTARSSAGAAHPSKHDSIDYSAVQRAKHESSRNAGLEDAQPAAASAGAADALQAAPAPRKPESNAVERSSQLGGMEAAAAILDPENEARLGPSKQKDVASADSRAKQPDAHTRDRAGHPVRPRTHAKAQTRHAQARAPADKAASAPRPHARVARPASRAIPAAAAVAEASAPAPRVAGKLATQADRSPATAPAASSPGRLRSKRRETSVARPTQRASGKQLGGSTAATVSEARTQASGCAKGKQEVCEPLMHLTECGIICCILRWLLEDDASLHHMSCPSS